MSCEDKHNNTDFKFCPTCGITLNHEETKFFIELNEKYEKYSKNLEELGRLIDALTISKNKPNEFYGETQKHNSFISKYDIKFKYMTYLIDNKFYSQKDMAKLLNINIDELDEFFGKSIPYMNLYKSHTYEQSLEQLKEEIKNKPYKIKLYNSFRKGSTTFDINDDSILRAIEFLYGNNKTTDEIKELLHKYADAL